MILLLLVIFTGPDYYVEERAMPSMAECERQMFIEVEKAGVFSASCIGPAE